MLEFRFFALLCGIGNIAIAVVGGDWHSTVGWFAATVLALDGYVKYRDEHVA